MGRSKPHTIGKHASELTLKQWKKIFWFNELHFLLHHVDGHVHARCLFGDGTRMHCGKMTSQWRECDAADNVLLDVHMAIILTCGTYKHKCRPSVHLHRNEIT